MQDKFNKDKKLTAKQRLMAEGKKSEQLIRALQKAVKKEVRV